MAAHVAFLTYEEGEEIEWGVYQVQEVVKTGYKCIAKEKIKPWFDEFDTNGHTLATRQLAIEQSSVVVPFITKRYIKSNICRDDLQYAYGLHKPIAPVYLENVNHGLLPKGVVYQVLTCCERSFDFSHFAFVKDSNWHCEKQFIELIAVLKDYTVKGRPQRSSDTTSSSRSQLPLSTHTVESHVAADVINLDQYVSQFVGKSWKKIGLYLGFSWVEMDVFERDMNQPSESVRKMLTAWKESKTGLGEAAAKNILRDVFDISTTTESLSWETGDIDDDKFLYQIGESIGLVNWISIAENLGFSQEQVQGLGKCKNGLADSIMDMLVTWRDRFSDTSTSLPKLMKLIEQTNCTNVAMKIARNIRANPRLLVDPSDITWCRDDAGKLVSVGSGGFANVYKARYLHLDVVVKIVHKGSTLPTDVEKTLKREVQTMQVLHQNNIIGLMGLLIDEDTWQYGIVMEYMPNGSLSNMLDKHLFEWSIKFHIICDVCSGMAYLHKKDIVHRDLKSANVLLDDTFRAYVADFGQSAFTDATISVSKKGFSGTFTHLAPEQMDPDISTLQPASDVWSFGILLFEIAAEKDRGSHQVTKRLPFSEGINQIKLITMINVYKKSPLTDEMIARKVANDCPGMYIELMRKCCEIETSARPEFGDLLEKFKQQFKQIYEEHYGQHIHNLPVDYRGMEKRKL